MIFFDSDFRTIFHRFRVDFRVVFGAKIAKKIQEKSIKILIEFLKLEIGGWKLDLGGWGGCPGAPGGVGATQRDAGNPGWASLRVKKQETDTDRSFRLQAQRLR